MTVSSGRQAFFSAYCCSRLVNGVVPLLRHGAVRGNAMRFYVEPERAFVADQRIVRGRLADHQRTDFAQQIALLDHVRGATATALFVGGDHQRDTGPVLELLHHAQRRDHERSDAAFHVAGAASIQLAAFEAGTKRIRFPCGRAQRHGIDMPGEAERPLAFDAADFGDEAGARGRELRVIDRKSRAFQQVAQMLRARLLGAGWIDGVELEKFARELQRIGNFGHKTMSATDGFS